MVQLDIVNVLEFLRSLPQRLSETTSNPRVSSLMLEGDHVVQLDAMRRVDGTDWLVRFCFLVTVDGILRIWQNVVPKAPRWKIVEVREAVRQESIRRHPLGTMIVGIKGNDVLISAVYALPVSDDWLIGERRPLFRELIVRIIDELHDNTLAAVAAAERA